MIGYVLTITGAYLLSLVLLHLLPHTITKYSEKAMIWVMCGFFIQFILQQLSHGVEHGHAHHHGHMAMNEFLIIMLGLSVHALTEGIPLAEKQLGNNTYFSFLIGIAIHKLPEAFALACIASHTFNTPFKRIAVIIGFSLLTPIAMLLFMQIGKTDEAVFSILFPLVTGAVLQIAASIIFETSGSNHRIKLLKAFLLLIGFGLGMISLLLPA
jgi:zinc transporter ZupT